MMHQIKHRWISVGAAACLVFALQLALAPVATAQSVEVLAANYIRATKLGKATFGMRVLDLETGEVLAEHNPNEALIPASNMKLVTTASALGILGADFHFSTDMRLVDQTLVIRGDGDPGFGDPKLLEAMGMDMEQMLDRWVQAVKRTNQTQFDAILIDDRAIDQEFVHPEWPRNQLHKWYCAQVAAINFNDNCLDLYARPRAPGQRPAIHIEPRDPPILLDNDSTSGKRNAFWASRKLGGNQVVLRGQVRHALTTPANVTIHDPPMFFGKLMQRRLKEAGIAVDAVQRVEPQQVLAEGRLLAEVQTTLPTVIARCNHDSQNLFAEALIKRMGNAVTGQPGGWANGAAAMRGFLARALGSDAASVIISDGSGMSRENRISARDMVGLLEYMHNDSGVGDVFAASLAAPGEPGTLEDRFDNVNLAGRVRAKTGYIKGVVSLSGYLTVGDHTVAFGMLLNDYYGSTAPVKKMMEKIVAAVDAHLAAQHPIKLGG